MMSVPRFSTFACSTGWLISLYRWSSSHNTRTIYSNMINLNMHYLHHKTDTFHSQAKTSTKVNSTLRIGEITETRATSTMFFSEGPTSVDKEQGQDLCHIGEMVQRALKVKAVEYFDDVDRNRFMMCFDEDDDGEDECTKRSQKQTVLINMEEVARFSLPEMIRKIKHMDRFLSTCKLESRNDLQQLIRCMNKLLGCGSLVLYTASKSQEHYISIAAHTTLLDAKEREMIIHWLGISFDQTKM